MSGAALLKRKASGVTTYWKDTFTEASDLVISSHIPDIPGVLSYKTNRSATNTGIGSLAPAVIVQASTGRLIYNGTARGPVFSLPATPCRVTFNVTLINAASFNYWLRVDGTTPAIGPRFNMSCTGTVLTITSRDSAGTSIGSVNVSVSGFNHDIIIEDDGTSGNTWGKVHVNGILAATVAITDTNTTRKDHAISLSAAGISLDNLLITSL